MDWNSMSKKNEQYAVLTGDIVKSTELSSNELDEVRQHVTDVAMLVGKWKRGLVKGKLEFFRGDAWQMLATEPAYALRVAVYMRAYLRAKSADTRLAVGIGPIETIVPNRISLSSGPAFVISGHALDEMPGRHHMAVSVDPDDGERPVWLRMAFEVCDSLVDDLSPRQAELIALSLHPDKPTHEQIAKMVRPKVDRPVVTKTLLRANARLFDSVISVFESIDWAPS